MLAALEDGGGADLAGGAGLGDLQADVLVAVVDDLVNAVVQEAEADGALAGADVLGRAGAGLGVDGDVLVEVDEELDALVVAVLLDGGVDDQLGRAGGVVVGRPDQALVLLVKKVLEVLRGVDALALKLVLVVHDAEQAGVDAVPVAVGVHVLGLEDVGSVVGLVGLEQALGSRDVVGIGGAAEPDVAGRVAVLLLDLCLDLAGGEALVLDLDTVELLEVVAGGGEVVLLAGAVDDERALFLGGLHKVLGCTDLVLGGGVGGGVGGLGVPAAAAGEAEAGGRDAADAKEIPARDVAHFVSLLITPRGCGAASLNRLYRVYIPSINQKRTNGSS